MKGCGALNMPCRLMKQTVFHLAMCVAVPNMVLAAVLKWAEGSYVDANLAEGLAGNTAYSSFTFLLGILIVFRTSQAYSRFWDGSASAYRIMNNCFDVASSIVAFCRGSKADQEKILHFQHMLIRLFSMLHAVMLAALEGVDFHEKHRAFSFDLIDAQGIDRTSLEVIRVVPCKVEVIFQWIQSIIVEANSSGLFNVPPPILTRAFQALDGTMEVFHDALRVSEVQLPFPYVAATEVLLVMHWFLTPIMICNWTKDWQWAAILSFTQVFILWSLNSTALELENPFEEDMNDLDTGRLQKDLNTRLLTLLHPRLQTMPQMTSTAIFDMRLLHQNVSDGNEEHRAFIDVWAHGESSLDVSHVLDQPGDFQNNDSNLLHGDRNL